MAKPMNQSEGNTEPGRATCCNFISKLWKMSPPSEAFTPLAGRIALSYSLEATGISCHQKKLYVGQGALVVVVTRSFCTAAYYSGMASLSLKRHREASWVQPASLTLILN